MRNRILAGYKSEKEPLGFDPMKALPSVTYDGELIFHMGGEEIHLYHPARAHTDGDSLVHFKNANIAHWGDAFVNNWVPVIDGSGSTLEWLQFIDRGIQLVGENAVMVPGHGAIAKAADVRRLRLYFTNMQDNVRKAIAAGKTREQAMDEITVPAYANLPGGAARIRMNVASVYDELKSYSVTRIDLRKTFDRCGIVDRRNGRAGWRACVTAIVNPVLPISSNASSSVASSPI